MRERESVGWFGLGWERRARRGDGLELGIVFPLSFLVKPALPVLPASPASSLVSRPAGKPRFGSPLAGGPRGSRVVLEGVVLRAMLARLLAQRCSGSVAERTELIPYGRL